MPGTLFAAIEAPVPVPVPREKSTTYLLMVNEANDNARLKKENVELAADRDVPFSQVRQGR